MFLCLVASMMIQLDVWGEFLYEHNHFEALIYLFLTCYPVFL